MLSLNDSLAKEKNTIEWYKKNKPDLLNPVPIDEKSIFLRIGIGNEQASRISGYLRLYPNDFIVEEVRENKEIITIEPGEKEISPSLFPMHLGCNLIKAGISTFDAINILAHNLEMKPARITYAGLKDVNAVTSQKIVFLDINSELFEKIKNLSLPNIFLADFSAEKKGLSPGNLFGNRFTIFIRTEKTIDEQLFFKELITIKNQGFLNFYSTQRFGTPRFLSHVLGKLLLQGKYEDVLFNFFTTEGLQETPLIKEKRNLAKESFGDWEKIEEIFLELPFTFRNELQLLAYLKKNPSDFVGALNFFRDQVKFWMYAYASYLFNQLLSLRGLEIPDEIPLLLSDYKEDRDLYKFWLEKHEIGDFAKNIRPFRFMKLQRRLVKTKIFPEDIMAKIVPEGVVLSFILEKGVYATTFLSNFFEIKEGLPLPPWVRRDSRDTKKLLGIGSLEAVNGKFGENISSHVVLF